MKTKASLLFQLLFIVAVILCFASAFTITDNAKETLGKPSPKKLIQDNAIPNKKTKSQLYQSRLASLRKVESPTTVVSQIENMTFYDEVMPGNMLFLGDFALIPQNTKDHRPTILRINLTSMKQQIFQYPQEEEEDEGVSTLVLVDFQNGDLGLGRGRNIYILSRDTLILKQRLTKIQPTYEVVAFTIYNNIKAKQSRILVQRGIFYHTEVVSDLKIDQNGKYVESFAFFYNLGYIFSQHILDLHLTSTSKALQLYYPILVYWQSLSEGLIFSNDPKYYLQNRAAVATSYSSDFFVVRKKQDDGTNKGLTNMGLQFEIFDLDANNEISLRKAFNLSQNQLIKSEFTSNDQQLFLTVSKKGQNKRNLIKVSMDSKSFMYANGRDGLEENVIDFNLFDAESDRMITLVERDSEYFLQLRSIGGLRVIHEINIEMKAVILEYKLVGNIKWGFTFAVAGKFDPYYMFTEDGLLYQYKVQGDKIKSANLEAKVFFQSVVSCHKYLISYYLRSDKKIRIFHFSTFKQAGIIDVGQFNNINVDKNMLIIKTVKIYMFDLSQSLQSIGSFFIHRNSEYGLIDILLPKRGIIYEVRDRREDYYFYSRMIYNISRPQLRTQFRYENDSSTCERIYYQASKENECNTVYYIAQQYSSDNLKWVRPRLGEYSECTKQNKYYPIEYDLFYDCNTIKLSTSTDKKYLIFVIQQYFHQSTNHEILVEVRQRDNLENIVFRRKYMLGQIYNYITTMKWLSADVYNSSKLIIKSINFILQATISDQINLPILE